MDKKKANKAFTNIIVGSLSGLIAAIIFYFSIALPGKKSEEINDINDELTVLKAKIENCVTFKDIDLIEDKIADVGTRINKIEADRFNISSSVKGSVIKNKQQLVKTRKIDIDISMNTTNGQNINGYYIHVIQTESGVGTKYYYQGSAPFVNNRHKIIPAFLGEESDSLKTFDIYIIINTNPKYEKNPLGVCEMSQLPDNSIIVDQLQLYRTR